MAKGTVEGMIRGIDNTLMMLKHKVNEEKEESYQKGYEAKTKEDNKAKYDEGYNVGYKQGYQDATDQFFKPRYKEGLSDMLRRVKWMVANAETYVSLKMLIDNVNIKELEEIDNAYISVGDEVVKVDTEAGDPHHKGVVINIGEDRMVVLTNSGSVATDNIKLWQRTGKKIQAYADLLKEMRD